MGLEAAACKAARRSARGPGPVTALFRRPAPALGLHDPDDIGPTLLRTPITAIRRRYDLGVTESDVYAVIGEAGFARLAGAFYAQVPGDDILGPMYPDGDLPGAEERLRDFLVFRFGGPARYAERRGHPRLRARHAPFRIDGAGSERWVSLMDRALDQAALEPEAAALLRAFFRDTASFLINRPG